MSSLGPAITVSVENVDRIMCELPEKSTAETGCKVYQSDSQQSSSSVAVFPCPHPALDQGEACQEGIALNDIVPSIVRKCS